MSGTHRSQGDYLNKATEKKTNQSKQKLIKNNGLRSNFDHVYLIIRPLFINKFSTFLK